MNRTRAILHACAGLGLCGVLISACTEDRLLHEDDRLAVCTCPDPDATCVDGLCVIRGSCTESSCDPAYACNTVDLIGPTPACVCGYTPETWSQCAARCESAADCGPDFECRLPEGVCRYADRCVSDEVCASGEVCIGSEFLGLVDYDPWLPWVTTCNPLTGDLGFGEACSYDSQCSSGSCRSEQCGPTRCRSNAECGPDDRCVSGSCEPAIGPCEYCDQPERICIGRSAACVVACSTSGECDAGDCRLDGDILYCREAPRLCADDEFLVEPATYGGFAELAQAACVLHQACWISADCPDSYVCIPVHDGATGYCGREVS